MPELPYNLERTVIIKAKPETVFRYFTDSSRWANWWGAGSTIDARPGGKVYVRHPNGVESLGEVLEVQPPDRIVFTYGYASGNPIPVGSSRVTVRLKPDAEGTRVHLIHEFAEPGPRDAHVQGWRFQLSVFSNVVANEVFSDAAKLVDDWFLAWTIADDAARQQAFAQISTAEVSFQDGFSQLCGIEDLVAHAGGALRFMPGVRMERQGAVRQCQGSALAEWIAKAADGAERMKGTNLFEFTADGRIQSVTGFAGQA